MSLDQFPHCDSLILHAPGTCETCDEYEEWQELRQAWGINFTGEHNPLKIVDPAEAARPLEVINLWAGNRPEVEEDDVEDDEDESEDEEDSPPTFIFEYTTAGGTHFKIGFAAGIWAVLVVILAFVCWKGR